MRPNPLSKEAVSLLVLDECVTGDTTIVVRDKETGEIEDITIKEFADRIKMRQFL